VPKKAESRIYWARIDKVVFANITSDAKSVGFDDSLIYEEISHPLRGSEALNSDSSSGKRH